MQYSHDGGVPSFGGWFTTELLASRGWPRSRGTFKKIAYVEMYEFVRSILAVSQCAVEIGVFEPAFARRVLQATLIPESIEGTISRLLGELNSVVTMPEVVPMSIWQKLVPDSLANAATDNPRKMVDFPDAISLFEAHVNRVLVLGLLWGLTHGEIFHEELAKVVALSTLMGEAPVLGSPADDARSFVAAFIADRGELRPVTDEFATVIDQATGRL